MMPSFAWLSSSPGVVMLVLLTPVTAAAVIFVGVGVGARVTGGDGPGVGLGVGAGVGAGELGGCVGVLTWLCPWV